MKNKDLAVIIDDDQDDQQILSTILGELDQRLHCLFFSDCESAIASFHDGLIVAPGYVFIDLNLHRINSDQGLLQLLSLKCFDPACVIIYSALITEHWRSRLQDLGIRTFIKKTGAMPALTDQLRHLLSRVHCISNE